MVIHLGTNVYLVAYTLTGYTKSTKKRESVDVYLWRESISLNEIANAKTTCTATVVVPLYNL